MHKETEYEKLLREGYIEEGTLVIHVDDLSKMEISEHVHEEMKQEGVKGERKDKSVVLVDNQGRRKRVSHLAFGYNKQGVQLKDGSFMRADELLAAMEEAVTKLEPGTFVVDRKGRFSSPEELLQVVIRAAGKIVIGKVPEGIRNHGRLVAVVGANSDEVHKKGTMVIGSKEFDISEGDYVNLDEFLDALDDYVIMTPKKEPVPPVPPVTPPEKEQDKPIVVRVVRKYKNKLTAWLILLAMISTFLSGFRINDRTRIEEVPIEVQEQIIQMIERDDLFYQIEGMEYEDVLETLEESAKRFVSELSTGDTLELRDGDELYENSGLGGRKVVIGQGIRQAGDYEITGVSIVYEGKIYAWNVDLAGSKPSVQIGDFINSTVAENNLDYDKIEVRLHFGGTKDNTQTGWIDISELIKEDMVEQQVIDQVAVKGSTYDGTVNDFKGSTITIDTLDGPVTITVVDENGNLLQPGTKVIGSDGKEYIISDLNIENYTTEETVTITETKTVEQEVVDGKKLTWRIQDCNFALAIAPLLGALAAHMATKKKNDEAEQNPDFFEFENEEEYQQFKKEFLEAREKYEKTSGFRKMLKNVFYRREIDILQRLTEEQIQKLYAAIRNWHDGDYSYNPSDKIVFKNGKILVIFKDGRTQDITDIVMPAIASIGSENKPETEGLLEEMEEQKDGIHRR
ncbi:MAG: hypothetical protein ACI4XM_04160 [Candidatus Coprovivens sp.]